MLVSAIVAVSKNGVIGKNNQIPWYLSSDLKYFKRTTMGHHVIMGRKSFLSIGRPLPKRTNIVITRDPYFVASGCIVALSVEEALEMAYDNDDNEAFIIGGGEIYQASFPYWDKLYYTEVDVEIPDGDVFFPEIDWSAWELTSEESRPAGEKDDYPFTFKQYERKQEGTHVTDE